VVFLSALYFGLIFNRDIFIADKILQRSRTIAERNPKPRTTPRPARMVRDEHWRI